MAAEGFKRLLGRPTLGLLQTLVRESIQNVLDAATGDSGPTVLIRVRTLAPTEQKALAKELFAQRPRDDATRRDIDESLAKPCLCVLELCDFGTEGLSGPTRADVAHNGEEPLNFVNFLRNVGAARDTHQGGGTYGYGKSSLYAMSACSTIVVDSQTRCAGRADRRLMACHLGAAFDAKIEDGSRKRFTGRHWWGVLDGSDSVEPVRGETARALSGSLGMPPRAAQQTGTSILIIDPLLNGESMRSTAEDIVETVLWNFWPRMTASTPERRKLKVHVEFEGQALPVPDPEQFPPLDLFAKALADHRLGGNDLEKIVCGNPKRHLGDLAITRGMRAKRVGPAAREGSIIPANSSHIALMRPVELVVKYIEGDSLPDSRFEWAGVFICSDNDEIEEAFALAEPPAHDDWVPDNLPKGSAKTFVRVALKRLQEFARPHPLQALSSSASAEKAPSLAATAARMGAFLDKVLASGPGRPSRRPGTSSGRKTLSVSAPQFVELQLDENSHPVAIFEAELNNDGSDENLYLVAEPHFVIDGGAAAIDDLPDGFRLGVRRITLQERKGGIGDYSMHVGRLGGIVRVALPAVSDAALGLRLRLQSGKPE